MASSGSPSAPPASSPACSASAPAATSRAGARSAATRRAAAPAEAQPTVGMMRAGASAANSLRAVVSDVEYQGTYVLLGLRRPGALAATHVDADWSVMLPEATFLARPFQVGEPVQLSWESHQARALSAYAAAA